MKVKALVDCVGVGYEIKIDETSEVSEKVADKLIKFGYVEEVKTKGKPREKSDD